MSNTLETIALSRIIGGRRLQQIVNLLLQTNPGKSLVVTPDGLGFELKEIVGEKGDPGATGMRGSLWFVGVGIPSNATGIDSDIYLDSGNSNVYQRVTGIWVLVDNIMGPQGIQGETGTQGPQGEVGPAGPTGLQGIQGETGTQGPVGTNGTNGTNGVDGQDIDHVSLTGGTSAPGTTDTYTVWGDTGETINLGTFTVYNGINGSTAWADITGKPTEFTPSAHNHDSVYAKLIGANIFSGENSFESIISRINNTGVAGMRLRNGAPLGDFSDKRQISMGFSGTDEYAHFIHTRHSGGNLGNNALDLYLCDGTQNNSITSGSYRVLSIDGNGEFRHRSAAGHNIKYVQEYNNNNRLEQGVDGPSGKVYRKMAKAYGDDGSSMEFVDWYDRDGSVVGIDTYQLRMYPKDAAGSILDYAGVHQLMYNRSNGYVVEQNPRTQQVIYRDNISRIVGAGDPNGSVAASVGSTFQSSNGKQYKKVAGTGTTGWTEMDAAYTEVDRGSSGASITFDFTAGVAQKVTLTANCTVSLTSLNPGQTYVLKLTQDATGGRTVTRPANIKKASGAALSTGANKVDIATIYFDGTNGYLNIGKDYA